MIGPRCSSGCGDPKRRSQRSGRLDSEEHSAKSRCTVCLPRSRPKQNTRATSRNRNGRLIACAIPNAADSRRNSSSPQIPGLSTEVKQKLARVRPETLGQAGRIPGVTPAAVAVLDVYLSLVPTPDSVPVPAWFAETLGISELR